jgi:hypothetical protein
VVAEFRYGKDRKSDAKAWQMWQATSTPGSITATSSKTASATLKAGALSPELVSKIHSLPLSSGNLARGPGAIRTRDPPLRRRLLYPLSYGAIASRVPVGSPRRPVSATRSSYEQVVSAAHGFGLV